MKQALNKYSSLSLVSIITTAIFTSIHHSFEIGFAALILVLIFIVFPALLMHQFRNTGKKVFLWIYGLLTAWLVVGLGIVDGLFNHTLKFLHSQIQALIALHGGVSKVFENTVENAYEGTLIFEGTAILAFIASMFAAYYGYKFIRSIRRSGVESE